LPERVGSGWCTKPMRAFCPAVGFRHGWSERRGRGPIETLGRSWIRRAIARSAKRVRGFWAETSRKGSRWRALKGRNPWEHPASGGLTLCRKARDSWKGESPEAVACLGRPDASRAGSTDTRNSRWVRSGVTARIPFRRRKLRRVNPMSAAGVK
jgi:hypothetical protein